MLTDFQGETAFPEAGACRIAPEEHSVREVRENEILQGVGVSSSI